MGAPNERTSSRLTCALCLLVAGTACADPLAGTPVSSPTWEIHITDYGYADFALDRRPGFVGREYLSGEWATAVGYGTARGAVGPIWLQPHWMYPDWVSNSDFGVEEPIGPVGRGAPTNAWGFPIFRSVVTNRHLQIVLTYEMVDSGTGIAAGIVPRSQPWPGRFLWTDRYVFRQTVKVVNRTEASIQGVRLFQFVHGLESACATYDDRDYGGPLGEFRYDLTLQGRSVARDTRTGLNVVLHDVLTLHLDRAPAAWEGGYFGRLNVDSHVQGKPTVGVHWSVETNALNGVDWFDPPEGRYVSGAVAVDLGDLGAGQSAAQTFLLTVASWRISMRPVRIQAALSWDGSCLMIAVEPIVPGWSRFGLAWAASLDRATEVPWRPLWWAGCEPVPARANCFQFEVPLNGRGMPRFYCVETWESP
ncbi:MAG: hypothetical protein RMN51_06535 [Verrucomicrobiota bacterium]|nr:hypothetical protein [Verrucomicrobiota bacterium]